MADGDLITLADYKTAVGVTGTSRDGQLADAITAASAMIADEYEREFIPPTPSQTTRRFEVNSGWVELAPYDLRSVVAVTFDPDGAGTVVDTASVRLQPVTARYGVHTALQLLEPITGVVDVEGVWGFPSVPFPVRRACVETVRAITRADPTGWAATTAGVDGRTIDFMPTNTHAIPPSARRWLDPFRRMTSVAH